MDESNAINYIKVSIVIPVYCVSDYIEGCILSVMKQTYPHIECIIVDDASPDDSIDKCEQLIAAYKGSIHFTILRHKQNRGISAARNTGTEAATGEYIYYLDSDDEITSYCISKLMEPLMKNKLIEMVQGNFVWIKKAGVTPKPAINIPNQGGDYNTREATRKCYFENKMPYAWNKLISKKFLYKCQIQFKDGVMWEDHLWNLMLMKYLNHLYLVPDVTYLYFRRPRSITTGLKRKEKTCHSSIIYNEIANNLTPGEEDLEVLHYLSQFCQHYLVAKGDPRFNHAYSVFYKVLADSNHQDALKRLERVRMITDHLVTRWLFEIALKIYHLYQDIVYLK